MPDIIPGRPSHQRSSLCISLAARHARLYSAYISHTSLYIFRDCERLVQIIEQPFQDKTIDRVAFDRRTGCIAVSCDQEVKIYDELVTFVPESMRTEQSNDAEEEGEEELNVTWVYGRGTIVSGKAISSLSWGLDQELLIGNDYLSLYHPSSPGSQSNDLRSSWQFPLALRITEAHFSPDASLIASYGQHDRLVKVWRRLSDRVNSTGVKTSDFDFTYLPHDRSIHSVKWRQPFYEDLLVDNIMYTTDTDHKFRAWASDIPHDSHLLTTHETLPLGNGTGILKIAVVLDDDVFGWALAKCTKRQAKNTAAEKARSILQNINKGQLEVVLLFDFQGGMEAFALHNLGSRNQKVSSQESFFRRDDLNLICEDDHEDDIWITADIQRKGESDLLFLVGRRESIDIYEVDLEVLFSENSPMAGTTPAFNQIASLSGHSAQISRLKTFADGFLQSEDEQDKQILWQASQQHLMRVRNEHIPTSLFQSNGHSSIASIPPESLKEAHIIQNAGSMTVVVTSAMPDKAQIWGPELPTSFTAAPLTIFEAHGNIVSARWDLTASLLSICTADKIFILAAQRLVAEVKEIWVSIWSYSVELITKKPIVDAAFVSKTCLVIACGCQLLTFDSDRWHESSELQQHPLPVYHPTFIHNLILSGNLYGARLILSTLHDNLVNSADTVDLASNLGLLHSDIFGEQVAGSKQRSINKYSALFATKDNVEEEINTQGALSSAKSSSLASLLLALSIPTLSDSEKTSLSVYAASLVKVESEEASLDEMGRRFYLSYIIMGEQNGRQTSGPPAVLKDEDIIWALESNKQDILVTLVKSCVKALTWQEAKSAKIFYWLKDRSAVLEIAEIIAKAEFLSGEDRDPVAASIWYFALQKKSTLLSLWRMSSSHPEHALTSKILANDFQVPKWRTAANKNAYALVGRRRFEYAAAWFLLAGSAKDAVYVCIRNLENYDLALAIARIFEGDKGVVLRQLVDTQIRDQAYSKGSRMLAIWCTEFMGSASASMEVLIEPFGITTRDTPAMIPLYLEWRSRNSSQAKESQLLEYFCYLLKLRGCHDIADALRNGWDARLSMTQTDKPITQPELSLEEYKNSKKNTLAEAPRTIYEEPTMDSFAAFDF